MDNNLKENYVLGIWDGHDAGSALIKDDKIIFAVNEERLTRRKLEVGFPQLSILSCLEYTNLSTNNIPIIAVSTSDPAKTLTRIVPNLKEEYYLIRRRKKGPKKADSFKKWFKYRFTELKPNYISKFLSKIHLKKQLKLIGFKNYNIHLVDHHTGHAQAASRCSGFDRCLVLTLDGLGDGLSGSISVFKNEQLSFINKIPSKISMGIFFEHVTNLMNMRELEDEGKVMALANYAYPVDDSQNPLLDIIKCVGLDFVSSYNSTQMFNEMKKIFWRNPSEQFAYMAQRTLEKNVLCLVKNAAKTTGLKNIALAGGVFSNIKLNMKIGELPEIDNYYVFPHMGDGGLAIGSAIDINYKEFGIGRYKLPDLYLGPNFNDNQIYESLKKYPVIYDKSVDSSKKAAELILSGEIILWFHGKSEIGPRALGNRSILAKPNDARIKDKLNLALKKRVWYQPFCPSILIEDASELLYTENLDINYNRFMTAGFKVKEKHLKSLEGVTNIDGTCRPQFVGNENNRYRDLLCHIKSALGFGVLLNTSFNVHGEPMVLSPDDALKTLFKTGVRYLFLEDFIVENPDAKNL
ncbi:MAG: hypothetical protein HQK78_16045 [Desulfobacterales bacterium]|nr:hypothetical protein [Desulfobacterales bacterium]